MKRNAIACAVVSALGLFVTTQEAGAAAFALYENGASGLGNAYAGAAAVAEDATTVWWNPAGMARLAAGKHFAIAGALIAPSTTFTDRGSVAALGRTLGGTGGDAGSTALVPSMFFVMDINPRVNFGLGINVPFGLKTEYDSTWLGRFQGIKSELKTININPAVSYKVSDALSVGFGIDYQRGEFEFTKAVNLGAFGEASNRTSLDGDAWGFNIGALFNVTPVTRLGVHYRSALKYETEGTTSFSGVPAPVAAADPRVRDGNVKLDARLPDNLAFSVAHRMSDRLELLGDITWWHWSRLKQLPVVRTDGAISGATANTLNFDFRDTWRLSAGTNYKWGGPWTLKFGVAYDKTPVPNPETRSVRLPDADRYWFSAGVKYQVSRSGALDFGYTFIKARNADINNNDAINASAPGANGVVTGTYKAHVNVFGLQYQHSF